MEAHISEIKKLSGYKYLRKLGKGAYLIEHENTKEPFIIKFPPPAKRFKQKISRFLLGGSLPFQNELRVVSLLNDYKVPFNIPLFKLKDNEYYIIPFLKDTKALTDCQINVFEEIGKTVALIQGIPRPEKWSLLKEKAFYYLESTRRNLHKGVSRAEKKYALDLSGIRSFIKKVTKETSTIKPRMIHGDLADNNIIITNNNRFYIIDWEDSRMEKCAVFLDIISISFDYENLELNDHILKGYWLNYKPLSKKERKNKKIMFAFSYLVFLFRLLNMKRWDETFKKRIIHTIVLFNENERSLIDLTARFMGTNYVNNQ